MLVSAAERVLTWRLFSRRREVKNAWEIITWWEGRRLAYNAILGVTGIFTCAMIFGAIFLTNRLGVTHQELSAGLFTPGVLIYGIAANVCFALGWLAECLVKSIRRPTTDHFGVMCFFLGVVFSLLLTLLPIVLMILFSVSALLVRLLS